MSHKTIIMNIKRIYTIFIAIILAMSLYSQAEKTFYNYKVITLEGEEFDFADLKGKKVLIVNTASKCGFTPQYEGLQMLYEKYGGDNFTIVGFPSNDFLKQEPGTHEEIREFCSENYGITFPMMEKISVKGKNMHPLYQWLTRKDLNGYKNSSVSWNFHKYLVDEEGNLVESLSMKTKPFAEKITSWIEE